MDWFKGKITLGKSLIFMVHFPLPMLITGGQRELQALVGYEYVLLMAVILDPDV